LRKLKVRLPDDKVIERKSRDLEDAQTPSLVDLLGELGEVNRLYERGAISRKERLQRRRVLLDRF
jgi:hypothetical protein